MFTGHIYNLQSDRGLISQRSMTKGGFQRLSSLSNFLWPNEMAETCLESFWLETLLRVNKEYDIHKSKWEVTWLPTWWFMLASFPLPLAVCAVDGQLETRSDWNQKSWKDLIPSSPFFFAIWIEYWFNLIAVQYNQKLLSDYYIFQFRKKKQKITIKCGEDHIIDLNNKRLW